MAGASRRQVLAGFPYKVVEMIVSKGRARSQRSAIISVGGTPQSIDGELSAAGKCEEEHHGDRDWYNRYELPHSLFMRDRDQRCWKNELVPGGWTHHVEPFE